MQGMHIEEAQEVHKDRKTEDKTPQAQEPQIL